MTRADCMGMFWHDEPVIKTHKEVVKCVPPERTWEEDTYLPHLEEALRFDAELFTMDGLVAEIGNYMVFDIECYSNYFLIAFQSLVSGRIVYFENTFDTYLDIEGMDWVMRNFRLVGFNSRNYDLPIAALALAGKTPAQLKHASDEIIMGGESGWQLLRNKKVKALKVDHIDLIEVAPLRASLKIYGGRLHAQRMQDLPFPHYVELNDSQQAIVKWYCINDLDNTKELYVALKDQLQLREEMSTTYDLDLRSKSDAQIAEAVLGKQMRVVGGSGMYGPDISRPYIMPGTIYKYKVPNFIQFQSALMNHVVGTIYYADFIVTEHGNIGMPPSIKELDIKIGDSTYTMGIGGLHSNEKRAAHHSDHTTILIDRDVTSYYPAIILNLGLYPLHLGPTFLNVYREIVKTRLDAKRSGNKVVAESLKITINGSFGKFGNKYSVLYSPDLLIQTTVTGQLALLMLIERLELNGIPIVSANTDGIVIKCPRHRQGDMNNVVAQWEQDTNFETEATEYVSIYSRDVNNYIAVKLDGKAKCKGAFSKAGLHKNPTNQICTDAVREFLISRTPIEKTIRNCKKMGSFVSVRTVKGGAVKDGEFLGKAIRWYYATDTEGSIIYADSGKKVPRSTGAKPLMDLPRELPGDIDYDWYIAEAGKILLAIGYE